MNKFLKRLYPFLVFPLVILVIVIGLNHYIVRNTPIVVPKYKNILVLGDSNPECAVNDSIFDRAYNMSSSGDSYFYSYLKLKKVIDTNKQIDTVLIGFAPHNIVDNDWLIDASNMHEKLNHYIGVMSYEDLKLIYRLQPQKTITAIPTFFVRSVINIKQKTLGKVIQYPGGFIALDRNKLDEDVKRLEEEKLLPQEELLVTDYEIQYLNKILILCKKNGLYPILLNTPKRKEVLEHENYGVKKFEAFYDENLSHISCADYSKMLVNKEYFGDLVHLNYQGANYFSKILKEDLKNRVVKNH